MGGPCRRTPPREAGGAARRAGEASGARATRVAPGRRRQARARFPLRQASPPVPARTPGRRPSRSRAVALEAAAPEPGGSQAPPVARPTHRPERAPGRGPETGPWAVPWNGPPSLANEVPLAGDCEECPPPPLARKTWAPRGARAAVRLPPAGGALPPAGGALPSTCEPPSRRWGPCCAPGCPGASALPATPAWPPREGQAQRPREGPPRARPLASPSRRSPRTSGAIPPPGRRAPPPRRARTPPTLSSSGPRCVSRRRARVSGVAQPRERDS